MEIFLTGATGFVGGYVLEQLVRQGHTVRCLVRPGAEHKLRVRNSQVTVIRGDVLVPFALREHIQGCEATIHLIGIIEEQPRQGITFERVHVEGTRFIIQESRAARIPRFIHMSANGARPDGKTRYQITKWQAEQLVQQAGFKHWVIFRPSFIFGDPGKGHPDIAVELARKLITPFPVIPILGDGKYPGQPIYVGEVAQAFTQAIVLESAHRQIFCAAGPEVLTFNQIVDRISLALYEKVKPKMHLPLALAKVLVQTAGRIGLLPITPDQFAMLIEGNTCDSSSFYRTFGLTPVPFTPEHLAYVKKYVSGLSG